MRIFRKEETISTNLDARLGVAGDVFVAEYQAAGRGRLDHAWHAAKGMNLTFSMVLDVGEQEASEVATLPLVVGLGVVDAVKSFLGGDVYLKWPNDVWVGAKKVCGILCERVSAGVIAGIGLNVNQVEFPQEICMRATSLALELGREVSRKDVLAAVLKAIEVRYDEWKRGGFAAVWSAFRAIDLLKGRKIRVVQTDEERRGVEGICGGIQRDGTLLVGDEKVYAGEAHVEGL